ncbi:MULTISPECIES: DegT/DnrJ/EryC1/StrS family aminotransferase [Streptomyces]|uniref:Aminotransferase DegT n=1 Tax=Streptomyces lasiicapitis TaxID=1923961 RepID=A0ABQ2M7U7_9ACTN|nr:MULTISPECIES: DegT/DnrJ/EryC1/StrS family aminotransferase [Streptomyces]GGO47934.1 aminotransferase DegT [Streptomyces lasiicapitis]
MMETKLAAARPRYTVPYARVGSVLDESDVEAVRELLLSGATLSAGPVRERFEEEFAALIGVRHALSVTSGTVALELAIRLLDLEPGDEVITTPQTYQATIQPLLDHDVRVRFADVDPATANIDPRRVAELITPRTRAIVLVHYGGLPADMDALMRLARAHDLIVVEDAAHALGSVVNGRRPGALGHIGCFSFHTSKNITTLGEGGMITTDRDDWAERLRRVRGNESDMVLTDRHGGFAGASGPPTGALYPGVAYTHDCHSFRRSGTNAAMSEAAAAMGLVQLGKLPGLVARRQAVAARLTAELAEFEAVRLPVVPAGVEHAQHLYTFSVDSERVDRDELVRCLHAEGVETYLRYFPLHLLPEWRARGHGLGDCPAAERAWFQEHMNLPCGPWLTDDQVELLATAVNRALVKATRD